MPSISIGFWVAITRNGRGRGRVSPATVTARSCMASSSADWVLGVARLISSASTRLAKIGPRSEAEAAPPGLVLLQHLGAEDVGRHEVGGELDPAERQIDRRRQGLEEHGLAQAGHAFEQHVALAQHADEDVAHELGLTDDHPPDLLLDVPGPLDVLLRGDGH